MKSKTLIKILSLSAIAIAVTSCSTNKLALQSNDDVYFSDVEANYAKYEKPKSNTAYSDAPEYTSTDNYYSGYNSRFDLNNLGYNYDWQDYYYMNRLGYNPFWGQLSFIGYNNFYNRAWSFSSGIGVYNNYYGYNNYFNDGWNSFGNIGFYNRRSAYGGIYSYYQPGYYGNNYAYNGSGYYRDPIYSSRPSNPRPHGSYDNTRKADVGSGSIPLPSPSRPLRPDASPSNPGNRTIDSRPTYDPNTSSSTDRPMRPTGSSNSPSQRPTSIPSQPISRPTRSERPSSQPTRQTESDRPTRTESRPSSPPPSSGSSSSSSSSSGSSNSRPVRTGGN
ncbi:MAG: hypothetical protein KJ712_04385 [Bacteroidetes bacterium]|nr:hypothetical protein [Bacteroidota bacterium]